MDSTKGVSPLKLIREYFGLTNAEALQASKALTDADKMQLASDIARQQGVTDLTFAPVEY